MDLSNNKIDGFDLPITNTRVSAIEWNQLVGSCMAFIREAGLTPDARDNQQFLNAFKIIASNLALVGANTSLSNLSEIGEAHFAKPDLSNINQNGKNNIITLVNTWLRGSTNPVMPNYSAAIGRAWGQVYTATQPGYVLLSVRTYNSQAFLTVDNIGLMLGGYDDNDGGGDSIMIPVGIGSSYLASGSAQAVNQYLFIPIKGA